MESSNEKQLQVRFRTRSPQYAVPDTAILIPTNLRRFGLSEVINHLLGTSENPTPFDFIIDGKFLRTTLEKYIEDSGASAESILEIEYVESTLPPKPSNTLEHEDWVSDIAGPRICSYLATGCYDGYARIWSNDGRKVATIDGHEGPVKRVEWAQVDGSWYLLTAGEDGRILGTEWDGTTRTTSSKFECVPHEGSADALGVNKTSSLFATGSWDQSIRLHQTSVDEAEEDEADFEQVSSTKRKRLNNKSVPVKKPIMTLNGHSGGVSSVLFSRHDENELFSGSWDHSLRIWDVIANKNTSALPCECVILDIAQSQHSNLIASGHTDDKVRFWDPRDQKGLVVKLKLSSHNGFTSAISWSPTESFKVASASHDGTVKVWDMRSTTPLHTIKAKKGQGKGREGGNKVFALDWDQGRIYFGGEGGIVEVFGMETGTSS
ncbi:WD repeat-containing protein 12 [Phlyctochytrium planicorne]|nr:WD repeat-containing protein 12 [Phlyctochytrium planicorne]